MIQFLGILRDGRYIPGVEVDIRSGDELLTAEFEIAWVDLVAPSAEELAWLGKRFHFHPLAIEDCAHFDQRPKIEEYGDHLFIVVHGLKICPEKRLDVHELHTFLTHGFVVTVRNEECESLRSLKNRMARDRTLLPSTTDFLIHKILDAVMDANPAALDSIETEIDHLDDQIVHKKRGPDVVERIHVLLRQLNHARHVLSPQRDVFLSLMRGEYAGLSKQAQVYFRDIYDHLLHLTSSVEALRENLWSIRDAHLAMADYRTNEAMKKLTVFSVIFLPLTFLTGFFGMNFEHIPFKSDFLMHMTLALVFVTPVAMIVWFKKRDWL